MNAASFPTKGTVTNMRVSRREWIHKMIVYGGFSLSEIKTSVRFYEHRDRDFVEQRYGWE